MSDITTFDAGGEKKGGLAGSFARAVRVLFSPSEVYGELAKKPEWFAPVLICIVLAILSSVILIPSVIAPRQLELLEERGLTEEQMEAARPWVEGNRVLGLGVATAVVGTPIIIVVVALVLHLVCAVIMGGQATFARTFSVVAFARMVSLPESIVKVPISLVSKNPEVQTSLALLLSKETSASFPYRFIYSFFNHIDIFALWSVLLVGVGVSLMFKFPRRKSYYVVGGLWLAFALLASLLGAVMPGPGR